MVRIATIWPVLVAKLFLENGALGYGLAILSMSLLLEYKM